MGSPPVLPVRCGPETATGKGQESVCSCFWPHLGNRFPKSADLTCCAHTGDKYVPTSSLFTPAQATFHTKQRHGAGHARRKAQGAAAQRWQLPLGMPSRKGAACAPGTEPARACPAPSVSSQAFTSCLLPYGQLCVHHLTVL